MIITPDEQPLERYLLPIPGLLHQEIQQGALGTCAHKLS